MLSFGLVNYIHPSQTAGKLNYIDAAELRCSAAKHVGPKLLMGFDAHDVEVIVADADRCVRMAYELCLV